MKCLAQNKLNNKHNFVAKIQYQLLPTWKCNNPQQITIDNKRQKSQSVETIIFIELRFCFLVDNNFTQIKNDYRLQIFLLIDDWAKKTKILMCTLNGTMHTNQTRECVFLCGKCNDSIQSRCIVWLCRFHFVRYSSFVLSLSLSLSLSEFCDSFIYCYIFR